MIKHDAITLLWINFCTNVKVTERSGGEVVFMFKAKNCAFITSGAFEFGKAIM